MAGYVLKIVMEDTHPPVWRRVLVPEKITFGDLHDIIQILFAWDGYHMHDFRIPSDNILIEQDIGEENAWRYGDYYENDTLVDPFFRKYKWVRYTYDFGDEWRHKIMIEKIDETYQERDVVLMKYKGDNFMEDSGGIYFADESARFAFDPDETKARLENLSPLSIRDLEEPKLSINPKDYLRKLYEQFNNMQLEEKRGQKQDSLMTRKIDKWEGFCESTNLERLEITEAQYSQEELLGALDMQETSDYCKYLQIPVKTSDSKEDKIHVVAQMLQLHPEYLLYTFTEEEFEALHKLTKSHLEKFSRNDCQEDTVTKAIGIGLCDFQNDSGHGKLSFAKECNALLGKITPKLRKDTYRQIKKFDERMMALLQVYGMVDLESFYKIYCQLYEERQDKTEFFRYIYWYGSFNCIFNTSYTNDGRSFASMSEIDSQKVLEKLEKYGKGIEYVLFSRDEIRYRAENLANRSDWIDMLFELLYYQAKMPMEDAQECLMSIVIGIMNGNTLEESFEIVSEWYRDKQDTVAYAEIWEAISGIMLELELPMLKGRNRIQYAEEKKVSPWTLDMTEHNALTASGKEMHMYEFPEIIQDTMYAAGCFGREDALEALWDYKKQSNICSEEFLYMLCNACITFGKDEEAKMLLEELEKGTVVGKAAAKALREKQKERYDVVDDEFDEDGLIYPWMSAVSQTPFVRQSPKIGRNDPCPCGSGKKYKKCCGK